MKKGARPVLAFASLILVLITSSCASVVSLEAAPNANSYACAEFSVRLPSEIDSNQRRTTDAQATAAWGSPASVISRCGLEPVLASSLKCVSVSGIDWLVDESNAPTYRFISFGRSPATEVIVNSGQVSGATVLDSLAAAVAKTPKSRGCEN